ARSIAEAAPSVECLVLIDAPADGATSMAAARAVCDLEALIAQPHAEVAWGNFDETAPCGLCFTSGTTGAPKGVTYTHRSSFLHTLRLLQVDAMAIGARDTVLTA